MNCRRFILVLSFIDHAAGSPVATVVTAKTRYAMANPTLRMRASRAKLIAAPPKPLPAKIIPFASPRLVLKYCAGTVATTTNTRLYV